MPIQFPPLCLASAAFILASHGAAFASPDDEAAAPAEPSTSPSVSAFSSGEPVEYGVGIRLRNVRAPQAILELAVDHAPGGVSNYGIGIDLVRRRGQAELQLGIEFERIQPAEGVWIERGSNVAGGDEADFILSPEHNNDKRLSWLTFELTYLRHKAFNKSIALRYGFGAGIGVVLGELARYNMICNGATNAAPEPGCVPPAFNGTGTLSDDGNMMIDAYDLPPVFPVVNLILGLQIRPMPKMTINIEGGIRTFPFFGISGGYFF
jgi:hypothetical protein